MKDFGLKKLYYSISEVSRLTNLEQYILRYWETEFEYLKPGKNRAGNRIYTNKDIKLILFIKKLLREEKYTIEGAKKILAEKYDAVKFNNLKKSPVKVPQINSTVNRSIKTDLTEIKNFLLELNSRL